MRQHQSFNLLIASLLIFSIAFPQFSLAGSGTSQFASEKGNGSVAIPVDPHLINVRLRENRGLRGAVLTVDGAPVARTPVMLGQSGKIVAEVVTDAAGEFEIAGIAPGVYQIASYAKSQNVRIWDASQAAPPDVKNGVVHVMPGNVMRGNQIFDGNGPLVSAITNPFLIAGVAAAAIAIGIAVAQDDDDAS